MCWRVLACAGVTYNRKQNKTTNFQLLRYRKISFNILMDLKYNLLGVKYKQTYLHLPNCLHNSQENGNLERYQAIFKVFYDLGHHYASKVTKQ